MTLDAIVVEIPNQGPIVCWGNGHKHFTDTHDACSFAWFANYPRAAMLASITTLLPSKFTEGSGPMLLLASAKASLN